jgi:hypothetical protein
MKDFMKNILDSIIKYMKKDLNDGVKARNDTGRLNRSLKSLPSNSGIGYINGEDYARYLKDKAGYRGRTHRSVSRNQDAGFISDAIDNMEEKDLDKFFKEYIDELLKDI